jgi:hypothetical protein
MTKLQGIVTQEDKDSSEGFALGIGKEQLRGIYLGDGLSPDEALVNRTKPACSRATNGITWSPQRKGRTGARKFCSSWNRRGASQPNCSKNEPIRVFSQALGDEK